jgi:hypothetical protein
VKENRAQIEPWNQIYAIDGGASFLQGSESSSNLIGYLFTFTFDQVSSNGKLSGGFTHGYMRTAEE